MDSDKYLEGQSMQDHHFSKAVVLSIGKIDSKHESINNAFARFNTIINSLNALDKGYSNKNYVSKFLRALHLKWRAKVTTIEELKDLTSLSLDELVGNLKFHLMIIKKDSEIVKSKGERKYLALKAKKESSDEECSTSGSEDEEYAMAVRDFKKFSREEKGSCGDPNHLIGECPKPPKEKNQRAFVGGSWSDNGEEDDEKVKDATCIMAHASSEICLGVDLEPGEWIKDSGCSKHMTGNRKLFSTYKAYNGGNVVFGSNLRGQIFDNKCKVIFSEHDSEITKDGKVIGRGIRKRGLYVMKLESLNVTFNETPPPSKTSSLVDDDLDEEEAIKVAEKKILENDIEDETLEIDEVVNIKESRNHPLENVIGNLKQMDVKSAFMNGFINEEVYVAQPPGFIDFEKSDHVYKLKKALYGLKQAPKVWYDRLKAFLTKHEYKIQMVDNILFTEKKSSNLIIVQIYVNDIIFGSTCQDMCNEFSKIMHDEFELSMMGELNFFLKLQIKQMEDCIFFNQSKYIKKMLKIFGLEDSKPMKTHMSSDTKLMKDKECESVGSTKYRGMIGTTHLGLWYPKGTGIETVVYADSDHAGDYVDRKSTSGICTFVGCCLTSWFSKKQTALAISTTEVEYISARKSCQQAL
ncbi:retrovirus-related pol polyprotein from transposon TNT 1-94 [Tanacetum coccineum]